MPNKFITSEGYKKLSIELDNLKDVERPKIIEAVSYARSLGDLSENAEYHAAKEKQGIIEGKIMQLESIKASTQISDISKVQDKSIVRFGASVIFNDLQTNKQTKVKIASEYETDPSHGIISIASPVAKELIGKKVGDVCEFKVAESVKEIEIIEILY